MKEILVPLLMGVALCGIGYAQIRYEGFARWAISHGRARIWRSLLGEERAIKLTQRFFGPLLIVFGVLCLLFAAAAPFMPPAQH
ncbi:MAG TPA: hypothetical protein VF457_03550 [Burkholderiaceae bacterium]